MLMSLKDSNPLLGHRADRRGEAADRQRAQEGRNFGGSVGDDRGLGPTHRDPSLNRPED